MKVKVEYDGANVHLSMEAETSLMAKTAVVILNLVGLSVVFIGLYDWLLVVLTIGLLWELFFSWLILWNFFGKEILTINTRNLSYQHHYGFYKTKIEHRSMHNALNISLIPVLTHHDKYHFQLIFESYNEYGLPEEIYRSIFPISETDLNLLKIAIRKLYLKKVHPDYINQPFLLN
jgi:hypothetical protein